MNLFLNQRDTKSSERMDDPECDPVELVNTYRQFSKINALISRWRKVYRKIIRPTMDCHDANTLLDIGFGGGDIPVKLGRWAKTDGYDLRITAIDPDPRAFKFVQQRETPETIEFCRCRLSELEPGKRQFDYVISNHLIHHLEQNELTSMLDLSKNISGRQVVFNDIRRDDRAYLFFNLLTRPFFRRSFITEDGLTSIKRSYTTEELSRVIPSGWKIQTLFPFRTLLTYTHE